MRRSDWSMALRSRLGDTGKVSLMVLLMIIVGVGEAAPRQAGQPRVPTPVQPVLLDLAPQQVIGIGGKIRLRGTNLGTAQNAVVLFHPGVIAEQMERHTPNEIIVRVPIGAQTGPIQVVTGVNAPVLRTLQTQIGVIEGVETPAIQAEIAQYKTQQSFTLSFGRFSNPIRRFVTAAYMNPKPSIRPVIDEVDGVKRVRNRLIVDLKDFLSFDVALEIADRLNAELVGHFPITNSYVLDLHRTPKDLKELDALMAQVQKDPRVAEVWTDMLLELEQVAFADVDVVDRYRHNYNTNLNGREDVWATDRIQAPGAWNLIERFIPNGRAGLNHVKVAVVDSGCDQTHPEFDSNGDGDVNDPGDVQLKKVVTNLVPVRIAGRLEILPLLPAFSEQAYDLGDPGVPGNPNLQHGTLVTSLIGARNGNVLDGATGDRGINGLLHNPMPYTIQVYRFLADLQEAGDTSGVTGWLAAINTAAITGAKVLNASLGTPPLPPGSALRPVFARSLRKIAHQLTVFQNKLLLVVAAGNQAEGGAGTNFGEIEPFEDLNLNLRLDAGEDLNGNGSLDFGNRIAASLGTLPNVIAVGAIGGPDHDPGPGRSWGRDDQRADFSNWSAVQDANGFDGVVQLAAPGTDVFLAGRGPFSFPIGGAHFVRADGTSFAAPLVTGSAALLKAIDPALTPAQLKQRLLNSAFEVNTTDSLGNLLIWRTLKTGYAVRQLMVDRGIIGNDQPWTGVSKVVFFGFALGQSGVQMFEIRRGANGRAEGFAVRFLVDGWNPSLRHDGRRVAFLLGVGNNIHLIEYRFDTHEETILAAGILMGQPLEYSPSNNLMWRLSSSAPCLEAHQVWVYRADGGGNDLIAQALPHNICRYYGNNPLNWRQWGWHLISEFPAGVLRITMAKGSWRPDNRTWDLTYSFVRGFGSDTLESCHKWWQDNAYPNPPVAIPECPGNLEAFNLPCWAPDGRARAGASGLGWVALVTRYYDSNHNFRRERARLEVDAAESDHLSFINWSPDGSEVAYLFGRLGGWTPMRSIRRDFRDIGDRDPRPLLGVLLRARSFSWQW